MIFNYRINKVKKLSKIITLIIILCLFSNGNLITVSKNSSLSEKFKNYFFVGAAINKDQILQKDEKAKLQYIISRKCNEVDVYSTKTEYILF
jgi:hypothetical protein